VRTIVYVDGFNLYYGALKGSANKWLDLHALFSSVLQAHNQIVCIKYFTARVSARPNNPFQADHQDAYLRALQATTPALTTYFGQFTTHQVSAKLVTPLSGRSYADVWRTSEKGSDVNLAVHLLNDAWLNVYDCAVLVSGDSDLTEAVTLVKTFHQQKKIGLLTLPRGTSKELVRAVDFVRSIRPRAFAAAQLPDPIPNTNIRKPPDW